MTPFKRLSEAYNRGKAAAYYGTHSQQPLLPCIWLDSLGIERDYNLSKLELKAWRLGFRLEQDRKEYTHG